MNSCSAGSSRTAASSTAWASGLEYPAWPSTSHAPDRSRDLTGAVMRENSYALSRPVAESAPRGLTAARLESRNGSSPAVGDVDGQLRPLAGAVEGEHPERQAGPHYESDGDLALVDLDQADLTEGPPAGDVDQLAGGYAARRWTRRWAGPGRRASGRRSPEGRRLAGRPVGTGPVHESRSGTGPG